MVVWTEVIYLRTMSFYFLMPEAMSRKGFKVYQKVLRRQAYNILLIM